VKLTTFTTICILSFDSSINSLNPNSEQKKKPKQQKKKKKKKKKKKTQNQTKPNKESKPDGGGGSDKMGKGGARGLSPTKWGREGLVGFRLVGCGLSPTK
jgi:hypothetical protein